MVKADVSCSKLDMQNSLVVFVSNCTTFYGNTIAWVELSSVTLMPKISRNGVPCSYTDTYIHTVSLDTKCKEKLVDYYKIYRDEGALIPTRVTELITLSLVKDDPYQRATVQKSLDKVVGKKEKYTYKDIFDSLAKYKFVLIVGRPGSGKTTLMNKIGQDWANKQVLESHLLILVQLRKLNSEHDRSLATILKHSCPPLSQSQVELDHLKSYILDCRGEGIVFAFDGLDEYSLQQQNDLVCDIMKNEKLLKATVLVTSRPAASQQFRRFANQQIEVVGFLKPQVKEYVYRYFETKQEKAQQLELHLEKHTNLMNMCYLPLHCAMLAFLYDMDNRILPVTETQFYKYFTISTLLRSFYKRNEKKIQ